MAKGKIHLAEHPLNKLRCVKCFVTLERLKQDQIADFLIRIVKADGTEAYLCPTCLSGW
ncbi:MAG: hypothetical protein Q7S65_00525 [Nanoarchaeota archaeon]|nr:hypothetical protein [Nanoarchaeota archaeon]